MKVGIKENSRIVRVSKCRVFKDMRRMHAIDDTRSELNLKAIERPLRKTRWMQRRAEQEART